MPTPYVYIKNMKLPEQIRRRFQRYGRQGGHIRAARMGAEALRTAACRAATARWVRVRFGEATFQELGVPGGDLVDVGLADLAAGKTTLESLLLSLAAPRLRREGVPMGALQSDPEQRLYELLSESEGDLAHARYGAYLRQILSFADSVKLYRRPRGSRAS